MVDTPIGYIKIPILSIAKECERDAKPVDAILPLTDGGGDVHVELDWVPLDSNLTTVCHITVLYTWFPESPYSEHRRKECAFERFIQLRRVGICLSN